MEYRVLTSNSPEALSNKVTTHISEGWKPVGGHKVVETHRQNRFSGQQHMDTIIKSEYSQTIIKE